MNECLSVELRCIGLDGLSELRSVHRQAFRAYLSSDLGEDQLDALIGYVNTPDYADQILMTESLGAWIDGRLCATASWMPGGVAGANAKLAGVCVDPLFGGLGLGRRLVKEIEARARRAGFAVMTARAPVTMAPFFERLGYAGTSKGVWATPCGVTIPVLHMRKLGELPASEARSRVAAGQRGVQQAGSWRFH